MAMMMIINMKMIVIVPSYINNFFFLLLLRLLSKKKLHKFELACLANSCPETAEEARALIPRSANYIYQEHDCLKSICLVNGLCNSISLIRKGTESIPKWANSLSIF